MLAIDNLHAEVDGKPILRGLTLRIGAGEVHAIMGPNGAGKSTLAYVLGGRPGYEVTEGSVRLQTNSGLAELVEALPSSAGTGEEEKKESPSTSSGKSVGWSCPPSTPACLSLSKALPSYPNDLAKSPTMVLSSPAVPSSSVLVSRILASTPP
jgi:energy-coupling factor transporter ATP-binding protein EcfA2